MNTIQHPTRRYYTDGHRSHDDATMLVSLPAVPGVTCAPDRTETVPTARTIRGAVNRRPLAGIALQAAAARRVQWVREALMEGRG